MWVKPSAIRPLKLQKANRAHTGWLRPRNGRLAPLSPRAVGSPETRDTHMFRCLAVGRAISAYLTEPQ